MHSCLFAAATFGHYPLSAATRAGLLAASAARRLLPTYPLFHGLQPLRATPPHHHQPPPPPPPPPPDPFAMASAGPAMEARADDERRQPSGRQRRQQLADEAEAELRRLRAQQPGAFLEHLAAATTPRDPADGPTAEEVAGPATHDHDQPAEYLNVRFEVPEGARPTAQRTLFVLVLDNSGSMAGRAWTQVQEATTQIVGEARLMEGVEVATILYNSEAHVLRLDEGYEREIAAARATGRTCFAQAFATLRAVIRDRDELAGAEPVDSVQVLFMTDGRDTSSQDEDEACRRFQDFLQRRGGLSKVSAVGFTPEHNYDLLERVRKTGTEPGVFRYAEAGDGGDALWTKLQDVFSLVAMNTKAVPLTLVANGLTLLDPVPSEAAVIDGTTLASIGAFVARRAGGPGAALGGATVELHLALAGARLEFPVELVQLDRPRDRTQWQLRILQRRIAQLSSDMASLILSANDEEEGEPKDDGRGGGGGKQPSRGTSTSGRSTKTPGKKTSTATIDTSGGSAAYTTTCAKTAVNMAVLSDEMMARVRQVQRALDKVAVFGAGMSKTFRQQVMLQRADMQAELDSVHRLIAQCAQSSVAGGAGAAGSGSDTSLMARAADIRFAGTFSKARRQRRMDQRVAANAKVQADIEAKLLSLQPDAASVQAIGEDALDFFSCSLSQANIAEVLEEEPTDVLGFCLALRRVEAVIDAPTLIQVAGISSTLATRSSIEDAIRYNISLEGHIKTHGGFDQDADLGVAVVGRAREPINAWLPLYINKDHWKRVRLLLPQSLGYAVTLDPLGYDRDQLNVLFMLLGTMIARGATTERDARLLFAYMRTVREVVRRFQLGEDIEAKVAAFVESPGGRTKDVIANLFTLFGYVAVLPKKTLMKLDLDKLLTALVTESMRRAADVVLRHRSDATRLEILARLVMGRMEDGGKQDPHVTEAEQAAFLERLRGRATAEGAGEGGGEGEAMPFQGWAFNASAGLRVEGSGGDGEAGSAAAAAADEGAATPQTLGPKACRMFASYGRAVGKCMPGPNVEDKTKAAEKAAAKWWKAFGDAVELAEGADEAFEPGRLTQGMLEAMAEIEAQIARTLYPQAQSLLRFATFMQSWTAISAGSADVWRELDANDGLAPDGWLAAVQAIGRLPRCSLLSLVELVIKPLDPLLFLRAAMLQAVAFHSNKTARSESAAGRFIDLGPRLPAAVQALEQQFAALQESRKKAAGFLREYQIWQRANQLLVRATDMWAFVGLLACTHSERGQGFQDLLEMVKDPAAEVLLRREKIEVLLTGKFEEASVFCRGNGWLPESDDHRTALMGVVGFEAYMEIERKLRANRAGHVYRESDIPNRHGYCNSHPHDPYHCDKCGRNRRANFWC